MNDHRRLCVGVELVKGDRERRSVADIKGQVSVPLGQGKHGIEIPQLCRLAPMADISNAPFRLIAKECGSGLTTTEEMGAFALLMDTPRAGEEPRE